MALSTKSKIILALLGFILFAIRSKNKGVVVPAVDDEIRPEIHIDLADPS
jgi:hypothetical protein